MYCALIVPLYGAQPPVDLQVTLTGLGYGPVAAMTGFASAGQGVTVAVGVNVDVALGEGVFVQVGVAVGTLVGVGVTVDGAGDTVTPFVVQRVEVWTKK